ncbi:beta-ketoacyl synthase N-terminal-like domain-containing protein [Kitasatospora sp. A2-31]|uniref:beta-ketoacyl synthase N-terminal-like domain-containing protein n=1 Tax=Kitasatospora sp. A2-31 TaxID=2916414 RepID=UPI001EEBFC17|nr:beta-ketoacyl synthase N-terminal-like domain-containing protein [Kitasatospora sp. A2-31]MCG6495252.1 3-oxoacyl-ACP synthase [Kitasatospora sp. A2-31]
MTVAVTGLSVLLPGLTDPRALLEEPTPDADPVDPAALIGRKGLRYKDRATQLGLCLAQAALTDAGLLDGTGPAAAGDRIGVVVSTNLGNADTVCRAVETIAKESTSGLSPMDTPNASSNIVASEIAIRYGLRGPNLTLCNGVTSGLDAVRWATLLLRSGRADHMLVIGVEPDNPVTRALVDGRVVDGGAGVVLGRAAAGAPVRALLGPLVRAADLRSCASRLTEAVPGAAAVIAADPLPGTDAVARIDLGGWGAGSGALGVLQVAAAVGWADSGRREPVLALLGGPSAPAATGLALRVPEERR